MRLFKTKNKLYLVASLIGAVATIGLTILIYATFFQDFLEKFNELSGEEIRLISRRQPNILVFVLSNLAHGFLIATIIRWGKLYTPIQGATAAGIVALLTDIYFCFTQYALFRTMSLQSAIFDTLMWTFINVFIGVFIAWILRKGEEKPLSKSDDFHFIK